MHALRTLVALASIACTCGCSAGPEEHKAGTISSSRVFGIRNLTVVRVEPSDGPVQVDWNGYNTKTGDALKRPYEEIRLSSGSEIYLISNETTGNSELTVNGELFTFDSRKQQLLIQFGTGVSIESGGDYQAASKLRDIDFSK